MTDDLRFMRRALAQAWQGWGRTTPNPLVGACVVTAEGVVVGQGAHERAGEPHAEVHALDEAGELARGATLYCTLEPCAHLGRTGPCVQRIIGAGIARVVAAMEDPFPLVKGRGFAILRAHGVDVEVGLEADAAIVGSPAPMHFTLKDMNGVPVKLSSFKGKIVMLNFWATWCPPCKVEIPDLVHARPGFASGRALAIARCCGVVRASVVRAA